MLNGLTFNVPLTRKSNARSVWIYRGYSFSGRIRHLEERWAYYLAFGEAFPVNRTNDDLRRSTGFPSAVICTLGTGLASFALFALIFPLVRHHLLKVQQSLIDLVSSQYVILATHGRPAPLNPYNPTSTTDDDVVRHPSPFIPIRLRVFAPVVFLNDLIAKVLDFVVPPTKSHHATRNRAFSDSSGSVEEGIELNKMKKATVPPARPARSRVHIGIPRKLD